MLWKNNVAKQWKIFIILIRDLDNFDVIFHNSAYGEEGWDCGEN